MLKKVLLIGLIVLGIAFPSAIYGASYTPNLRLKKPTKTETGFLGAHNDNMQVIDNRIGVQAAIDAVQNVNIANANAMVQSAPEGYRFTGTLNSTTGTAHTLPKAVSATTEYGVFVTPLATSGTIGEIYVTKGTTTFTVKCSGADTSTAYEAVLYYLNEHDVYGASIQRTWYASPSTGITDHGDSAVNGSLAFVDATITAAGEKARVVLPSNAVYQIRRDTTISANMVMSPQPNALVKTSFSVRETAYKWTASSTPNAYYLELAAGGDPSIYEPTSVHANAILLTKAANASALSASEWAYDNRDALGYSTIYIRLADSSDPDEKAAGWVEAGYTLTINGPFEAGEYQVFSGSGTVKFGTINNEVLAEWFGTDGAAIQAAVNSLAGHGTVKLSARTYAISAMITTPNYITIRGSGIESTTLSSIGVATSIFGSTTAIMQQITFCDMTLQGDATTSLALLSAEKGMHTCRFYRVRFFGAARLMTLISDAYERAVAYNVFEDCVFYPSGVTDYGMSISVSGTGWATFNRFTRCKIASTVAGKYGIYLDGASAIFDQCELAGPPGVGARGIKLVNYGRATWRHSHLELSWPWNLVHDIEYGSALRVDENLYLSIGLANADYRIMDKSYDIDGFYQTLVDGADKDFMYFSKNLFPNPQFFNTTSSTLDGWVTNCGSLAISADEYPDSMASGSRVLELTALSSQAINYIRSAEIDVKGLLPAHAGFDHRFYLELRVYMPAGASTTNQKLYVYDSMYNYFISNAINNQLTPGEWSTIRVLFRTPAAYVAALTGLRVEFNFTAGGAPTSNEVWKFTRPILKAISVSPLPLDSEIIKLASAPADGTWQVGAVVFNSAPAVSEYAGWICTVAGTPGTWRGFGYIPNKGAKAARPTPAATDYGAMYLDTTLDADGLPIFWQGTKWIKADGSDA